MFTAIKPIKAVWYMTLGFNEYAEPYYIKIPHKGLDLRTRCKSYPDGIGTPIYACANGEWVKSAYDKKAGNIVVLKHANGYESRYYHLSKSQYKPGYKRVKVGDLIGYSGNTGSQSTAAHLHFEIRKDNTPVNPLDFLV